MTTSEYVVKTRYGNHKFCQNTRVFATSDMYRQGNLSNSGGFATGHIGFDKRVCSHPKVLQINSLDYFADLDL